MTRPGSFRAIDLNWWHILDRIEIVQGPDSPALGSALRALIAQQALRSFDRQMEQDLVFFIPDYDFKFPDKDARRKWFPVLAQFLRKESRVANSFVRKHADRPESEPIYASKPHALRFILEMAFQEMVEQLGINLSGV